MLLPKTKAELLEILERDEEGEINDILENCIWI